MRETKTMKIKLIADSTCDLSDQLLEQYAVQRIPLHIIMGEQDYLDGEEVRSQEIFDFFNTGKGMAMTAAINAATFAESYQQAFANGAEGVLVFTISAELSSCYANALEAAAGFQNVHVIDTRSLSTGGGLLVLAAADMAAEGLDAAEIARRLEVKKGLVDTSFVIDTLEYMYRGGRCSGATKLGADLLNIKPCLVMRNGFLEVGRKYRGRIQKVLPGYICDRLKGQTGIDKRRAFITHTFFDEPELVRQMANMVKELQGFDEVLETQAGCTVSCHCGPRTLGVIFCRQDATA
ncbi:MAG: DegV family protein [Coriobacteriia bacterium]|nr:DegV family protein [Coriobacteriia bacterium]